MIHHMTRVPIEYGHGLTIFCFGDLQWGADGFDLEAWHEFRDEFKKTKNAWALGLGDYEDWLRPSVRGKVLSAVSSDDSARQQLDNRIRRMQDELLDEMEFLKGKCIGIHSGHHDFEFTDGSKSSQRIAAALKAPYIGWMASTRLCLNRSVNKRDNKANWTYTIVSTHGNANARKTGGAANWAENNLEAWDCDHVIVGHCCKSLAWVPQERMYIKRHGAPGVERRIKRYMQVGGFHRGYGDKANASYVERNAFPPQPLGWGIIKFRISQSVLARQANGLINPESKALCVEQFNHVISS